MHNEVVNKKLTDTKKYYDFDEILENAKLNQTEDQEQVNMRSPYRMPDGAVYKGEWSKDLNEKEGFGTQVWPDGSIYEGLWANNKANGKGRLISNDGDVYIGEWKNDMSHGKGLFMSQDGTVYIG